MGKISYFCVLTCKNACDEDPAKFTGTGGQETAGHELHAAAVSLEHGFAWAGEKLEAGMIKVMDDARHIAGKLIEGSGWAADEVGKAIEYLGREIDKLGKAVAGS